MGKPASGREIIPDMAKPNFLIIGAMKCATSTVATYLEAHPNVDIVQGGEPRYFSSDENYEKGCEWYASLFDKFNGERVMGEGSNDYAAGAVYPESAARIASDLPDVKLVFMVRHPLKRIVSAWAQYRADSDNFVPSTLDAAVRERADYLIDQSLFWKNLQRYRALFDDSQIFVGFMEDLADDPESFWSSICTFLGVDAVSPANTIHANPTSKRRVPSTTYSNLKGMSILKPLGYLLPRGFKRYLRNDVFSHSVEHAAQFSPSVKTALEAQLRGDAQALLAHCGKPADFWDLGGSTSEETT
jgi:hypothetical protein